MMQLPKFSNPQAKVLTENVMVINKLTSSENTSSVIL